MKVLILVGALVASIGASDLPEEYIYRDRALRIQANLNKYFDDLLANIRNWAVENGLDPLALPDHKEAFSLHGIIIEWHGELVLTEGSLKDIATLNRRGDILIDYDHKQMKVSATIGFDDLKFIFDYEANFMDISYIGYADGTVSDLTLSIEILADLEDFTVSLQSFEISHTGNIKVAVHGNGLLDILANSIANIITGLFKNVIMGVVQFEIQKVLEQALSQINLGGYV